MVCNVVDDEDGLGAVIAISSSSDGGMRHSTILSSSSNIDPSVMSSIDGCRVPWDSIQCAVGVVHDVVDRAGGSFGFQATDTVRRTEKTID